MDILSVVKKMYNPIETIDRMTAETKLMNVIRRLLLLTQDIRPADIIKIADCIDVKLCEIMDTIDNRSIHQPARPFKQTREDDGRKPLDKLG